MRQLRLVAFAVLALAAIASSASAQRRGTNASGKKVLELGLDAQLSLGLDDQGTRLDIPVSTGRFGIFVTDVVSIEPFLGIHYIKPPNVDGITAYDVGVGGLYHFSVDRTKRQLYVRPFLDLVGFSAGGNSDSDIGIGVGFGIKWPRMGGRIAWRAEANIFSVNSQNSVNFLGGLSFFPR